MSSLDSKFDKISVAMDEIAVLFAETSKEDKTTIAKLTKDQEAMKITIDQLRSQLGKTKDLLATRAQLGAQNNKIADLSQQLEEKNKELDRLRKVEVKYNQREAQLKTLFPELLRS